MLKSGNKVFGFLLNNTLLLCVTCYRTTLETYLVEQMLDFMPKSTKWSMPYIPGYIAPKLT